MLSGAGAPAGGWKPPPARTWPVAAEAIHSPGATTSGFIRPSRVGPLPEVQVTPKAWGASRCVDPTATQSRAWAGSGIDPMMAEVLAESPRVVLAPYLPADTTTTTPEATRWFTAWHSGDW